MAIAFSFPTESTSPTGTWSSTFSSGSGGLVVDINGIGYGEILNSQIGEVLSINSITLQPYSSPTYTNDKQISQLLEPIVFSKKLANGKDKAFVLNPIVDINQNSPTLKHISLREKSNDYILDGTTKISFQLLPYAVVNFQIEYTKLSNFDLSNSKVVSDIVKLNKLRNKKEQYLSEIAKEYTISNSSEFKILKQSTKKKSFRTIIDMLLNR